MCCPLIVTFQKTKHYKMIWGSNHIIFPGSLKQISQGQCWSSSHCAFFPMMLITRWLMFVRTYACWMWKHFERHTVKASFGHLMPLSYSRNMPGFLTFLQPRAAVETTEEFTVCRIFYTKAVAVEYISLGFLGWKKVLLSLCLTSCVVARRHWFIALIGRLVRQSLCVCVIGRFVGFLVLDENFAHQLLRTGQRDTWLQLQIHTIEEKKKRQKREKLI